MSGMRALRLFCIIRAFCIAALTLFMDLNKASAQDSLPAGFVYLRDVDPTIVQEIRYATSDNFVGRPLPGYNSSECILREEVAAALKKVQARLAELGLALKVYDCYRPARAVRAMAQWSSDGLPGGATKRFFPRLEKSSLFALGYVAATSRHQTGIAVDLTLIETPSPPALEFDPAAKYGMCNGPVAQRAPDNSLDMGTGYDCLDVDSHTANLTITAEQQRRRKSLVDIMKQYGFKNYFREWWHFEYLAGTGAPLYDFPILPRRTKTGE
jgi:D-alanyl-D-alanine dipeptidase